MHLLSHCRHITRRESPGNSDSVKAASILKAWIRNARATTFRNLTGNIARKITVKICLSFTLSFRLSMCSSISSGAYWSSSQVSWLHLRPTASAIPSRPSSSSSLPRRTFGLQSWSRLQRTSSAAIWPCGSATGFWKNEKNL